MRDGPPSRHSRWKLPFALIFGGSAQALAFPGLYPFLKRELALESGQLSLLIGGYTLVYAATTLASGIAGRRWSPVRMAAWATAILGLGLILLPFAGGLPSLLGCRLLAAVGHALLTPSVVLWAGTAPQTEERFRLTGRILSGHALAAVMAVPLGVWLAGQSVSPLLILSAPGWLLMLPAALALWRAPSPAADGIALRRVSWRQAWLDLWLRQPSRFVLLGTLLATAGTSGFVLYFPILLTTEFPSGEKLLPVWLLIGGLGQCLTAPGGGDWASRRGLAPVLLCSTLGSVAVAGLGALFSDSILALGLTLMGLMALSSLRAAPLQTGILQLSDSGSASMATALLNTSHQVGRTIGSMLGLLAVAPSGPPGVLGAAIGLWLLASVLFLRAAPAFKGSSE